ncbi:glycosyltransferase 87 family protein [Helicobacter pylori]
MSREWTERDLLPPEASALVGGPLGRRVALRERSLPRLLPFVVLLVLLPMGSAFLRQGHCVVNGWNGNDQFWRGCFSDLPAQYQLAGLDRGVGGWLTGEIRLDQMPLLSGLMSAVGGLVPEAGWLDASRWYMALWTIIITLCLVAAVWCVGMLRSERLDLATQLALSPVHVVAALLSPDLVVVTLVMAAMLADTRRRPVLAGVLLGLALLGHAWVGIVAVALVVAARRVGHEAAAVRTVLVALGTAVGLAVVLALASPDIVTGPLRAWWGEKPGYGSVLLIPELAGHPLPARVAPLASVVGWGVAVWACVVMVGRAWRPATWAQVAAFAVPVVALTSPSVPVQAALWVLPLALLAGVSWRTHLGLVAVEAVHATALWLHIGAAADPDKGLPAQWYAVAVLGRAIAWGFLMWSVWYTPVDNPGPRPQARALPDDRPQEPVAV